MKKGVLLNAHVAGIDNTHLANVDEPANSFLFFIFYFLSKFETHLSTKLHFHHPILDIHC